MRTLFYSLAAFILISALLLYAVARTELVSDTLEQQIEAQFAATYHGTLTVGAIQSNLWKQISLGSIKLHDAEGRLWLSIDSVIATPRWSALLSRRFEVGKLQILNPALTLHGDSARIWDLPVLLRRRAPLTRDTQWLFESLQIDVQGGTVVYVAPQASEAHVLESLNLSNLSAHASVVWGKNHKHLEIDRIEAATMDPDLMVRDAAFVVNISGDTVQVSHADMYVGSSRLLGRGATNSGRQSWQATLETATLDFPELQRLIPGFPALNAVLEASGHVQRDSGAVHAGAFSLAWGDSQFRAEGTASGLPDSMVIFADIESPNFIPSNLDALIPAERMPAWLQNIKPLSFEATSQVTMIADTLKASTSAWGSMQNGSFVLVAEIVDRPENKLNYDLTLTGQSLVLPVPETVLTGTAHLIGRGTRLDDLDASLVSSLGPSRISGRLVDSLKIDLAAVDQHAEATLKAFRLQSEVGLTASMAWSVPAPQQYGMTLHARDLDLGPVLGKDSLETAITGTLDFAGQSWAWPDIQGSLEAQIESALIQSGRDRQLLPKHELSATLDFDQDLRRSRLAIDGNLLSGSFEGDVDFLSLVSLSSLWSFAAQDALERQSTNLYALAGQPIANPDAAWPPLEQLGKQDALRATLNKAGRDQVTLTGDLQLKHPAWASTWLSLSESIPSDFLGMHSNTAHTAYSGTLRMVANADSIALAGSVLETNTARASATLDIRADLRRPLEESLEATIAIQVPRAERWNLSVADLHAMLDVDKGTAQFRLTTGPSERIGPVALEAMISPTAGGYQIDLEQGSMVVNDQLWQLTQKRTLDLFWDAIVLKDLAFVQAGSPPQLVAIEGVVSDSTNTYLSADLRGLSLGPLSTVLGIRRDFGGYANGGLQWSLEDGLIGNVTVDTLTMNNHTLGRLEARSRLATGTPDVNLEVSVHPLEKASLDAPLLAQNDLAVSGTMRLKRLNDAGNLDLAIDVHRLDAFILEELVSITKNTAGAFRGRGKITGTLQQVQFETSLDLVDVGFSLPTYNLIFAGEGSLSVNERGVHTENLILRDSTGGTAVLEGSLLFNEYRFLSFDLTGEFDAVQIMNRPTFTRDLPWYGTVWASGDASLTGPLDNALLRSNNVVTDRQSEVFIPIREVGSATDPAFITYHDPAESAEQPQRIVRRSNILSRRPVTERTFGTGLEMDFNIEAPEGSTIHMVIDPLLGDVITGTGTARIQLQRQDGAMVTYGVFEVTGGNYLFTAGEVFVRRFLINEGSIQWEGEPLDPILDIQAEYRTRASRSGLPEDVGGALQTSLPLIVDLHITGPLNAIQVGLSIALDQRQEASSDTPLLESFLNQPDRAAQHASSVLLTNSFLLSTEGTSGEVLAGSALNSVSQLATSQLNRYLSQVIPNADFAFGVLSDETVEDLDVSAGIALRLLDERLLIRGQGIYRGQQVGGRSTTQGLEGEFVVEIRLGPSVSVDLFHRREGDVLSETLITTETGVGLNYRTQFATWHDLWRRISRAAPKDSLEAAQR